jgi:hypothetical protein
VAEVTRANNVSLSTVIPGDSNRLPPYAIAEDIAAGDACYLGADSLIHRTNGTATGAAGTTAEVHGFAVQGALLANRQRLTLYHDVNLRFADGLTPGTLLYRSATTIGGLQTTVPATFTAPVGVVLPDGRARVWATIG